MIVDLERFPVHICYIDEAGCTGKLPSATSPIQPIFVIGGIILDQSRIISTTLEYINLKRRFYPNIVPNKSQYLEYMLAEIKGSETRRRAISNARRQSRHALRFLDHFLHLLETQQAKIFCRLYVKGIGAEFYGKAVYTAAMQSLCQTFQNFLEDQGSTGILIADSRNKRLNTIVSHSIFTQKFKVSGDRFNRILELPTFGHSENHAGLQLADLLSSALLFPIAAVTYCFGHVTNVHVNLRHRVLRQQFGVRLKALQYRYEDHDGRWRGGITVADAIGRRSSALMFS